MEIYKKVCVLGTLYWHNLEFQHQIGYTQTKSAPSQPLLILY